MDGVTGLLGAPGHAAAAAGRDRRRACARWRATDGPLATLTRLWPLQAPVPVADAERALPGLVGPLAAAGVLARGR